MFSEKGTKIDKIFTVDLTLTTQCQIDGEDFINFCGLLRKHELYLTKQKDLNNVPTPRLFRHDFYQRAQSIAKVISCQKENENLREIAQELNEVHFDHTSQGTSSTLNLLINKQKLINELYGIFFIQNSTPFCLSIRIYQSRNYLFNS